MPTKPISVCSSRASRCRSCRASGPCQMARKQLGVTSSCCLAGGQSYQSLLSLPSKGCVLPSLQRRLARDGAKEAQATVATRETSPPSSIECTQVQDKQTYVRIDCGMQAGRGGQSRPSALTRICLPNDRFMKLLRMPYECASRSSGRHVGQAVHSATDSEKSALVRTHSGASSLRPVHTPRAPCTPSNTPPWLELGPGDSIRRAPRTARALPQSPLKAQAKAGSPQQAQPGVTSGSKKALSSWSRYAHNQIRSTPSRSLRCAQERDSPVSTGKIGACRQQRARTQALCSPSAPLLKRRVLLGAVRLDVIRESTAHASGFEGATSATELAPTYSTSAEGSEDDPTESAAETALPLPECILAGRELTHDQVQQIRSLEEQRNRVSQVVRQGSESARGLRGLLPLRAPAAIQAAVSSTAQEQRAEAAMHRARPCDVAVRCQACPEPATQCSHPGVHAGDCQASAGHCTRVQGADGAAGDSAGTDDNLGNWDSAEQQSSHCWPGDSVPSLAMLPDAGWDGRDAQGRCVDKHAYRQFYGMWPGREALLNFEEHLAEVAATAPVSKKARRRASCAARAICTQRAASELQAIGFPAVGGKRGYRSQRRTSDSFQQLDSLSHCHRQQCSGKGLRPLQLDGQKVKARVLVRDASSQHLPPGLLPHVAEHTVSGQECLHCSWTPDIHDKDDTCRCASVCGNKPLLTLPPVCM
jgi:hypothetical protein